MALWVIRLLENINRLWTINAFKKKITSKTIIGERSIPPKAVGIRFLIWYNKGSVTWLINRTIGLNGSGFTQDKIACAITSHIKKVKPISSTWAMALIKLASKIMTGFSVDKRKKSYFLLNKQSLIILNKWKMRYKSRHFNDNG